MSTLDPNTHYFLNDWLQNRFLILNIGTTSAGKTYTTFRIIDEMKKAKHPPSHLIFCTTSGGLDRTLRKQSKNLKMEIDYCTVEDLPDKTEEIIADWLIVKKLNKLKQYHGDELRDMTSRKINKLEEDIFSRYGDFDIIKDKLQKFIDNIREVLHKTEVVRKRTPHGVVKYEKPLFDSKVLRQGLKVYQDAYGSKEPINVVVCIDDYMSDKQLIKNDSVLQKLIVKRRHLGLSFVINLQRLVTGISKTIRSLVNTFILFKGVPTYDLEQVAQAIGVPPREKNAFIDKYNQITNQYQTSNGQKYSRKAIVSVEKQDMFMF